MSVLFAGRFKVGVKVLGSYIVKTELLAECQYTV